MQNKILVATKHQSDAEQLEEILAEFLDKGGELLFVQKREEALTLLCQYQPLILFLDNALVGNSDDWLHGKTQIILLRDVQDNTMHGEDFVDRPLKQEQVLEKCRAVLESVTLLRLPPM